MRLFRPFYFASWFYPDAIFRIKTKEKLLCLTFDDGPDPESTPRLLEILKQHSIKVIFFCNGLAVENFPDLISLIRGEGHIIGNHGYSHLNGWTCSVTNYLSDIRKGAIITSSSLFRPPYGRLRIRQYLKLKSFYSIVFWDIMPYDFDRSFGVENSLEILKDKIRPGSIIVLHDHKGSSSTKLLEYFINYATEEGYKFILPDFAEK